MNATNKNQAVAMLTANFRKCDYGYIACSTADSAIAESFLPENIRRNGAAVYFKEAMLDSFLALANSAGVKVMIVDESKLGQFSTVVSEAEDSRDW